MIPLPQYLFTALAVYDLDAMMRDGLTAAPGEALVLHATIEEAEAAAPGAITCMVMVHAERMADEGCEIWEGEPGQWTAPDVPARFLWISEREAGAE